MTPVPAYSLKGHGGGGRVASKSQYGSEPDAALSLAGDWQNENSPAQSLGIKGKKPTQQP